MGYTLREACAELEISLNTARRWIKQGRLEARLKSGPYGDEYEVDEAEIERIKAGYTRTTTIVRSTEEASTVEVPTTWLLTQLEDRLINVIRETVKSEVEAEVSAGLEKLQQENKALRSTIEDSLAERDRKLGEMMRELMEQKQQQKRRSWWRFGR